MQIAKYAISIAIFLILLGLETVYPLFRDKKNRLKHGARNVGINIMNAILLTVVFSAVYGVIYAISSEQKFGLFYQLDVPMFIRIAVLIIGFDVWMYIWHRMNHEIEFLWRFHRMHHTDPAMDVTTAMRFHPVELIFSSSLRLGIIILLGMRPVDILLYETIMLPIIYFHHSNFYIPQKIDNVLRQIIVTPWMHWVHHSQIREESNMNYGTIFSWWDRIARTFKVRSDPKNINYGVKEIDGSQWQTMWGMIKTPFVNKFDS